MYSAVLVGDNGLGGFVKWRSSSPPRKKGSWEFSKALLEYTGRSPNVSRFSEMESAREEGNQEHRRNIRRTTGYFVFEQKDMDFEV